MNRMPRVRGFKRWMLRPVMLVLTLAQLIVVLAPSIDRAEDRDSGIHMETQGTRLHAVHDDAACPACQAQHLIGRVVAPSRVVASDVLMPGLPASALLSASVGRDHHDSSPRAPPVARIV